MYKIIKNMYKIVEEILLKLAQMGKVIRPFCSHQNFVSKGLSAPALGLYTHIILLKMCLKSDFKEILLKLATNGQSEKAFLLTSDSVPRGCLFLSWAYIHV